MRFAETYAQQHTMKTKLHLNIEQIGQALSALSMPELRDRFAECYGHATNSRNKAHLIHRIIWAMQRDALGDIGDTARNRALAIADDRDVKERASCRRTAPAETGNIPTATIAYQPTDELLPGTVLHRKHQGADVRVLVLETGFEWNGQYFKSLSATARAITGTRWNGRLFFGLKNGASK